MEEGDFRARFLGLLISILMAGMIFPAEIEARETPQLTSLEALEAAFEEAIEWDSQAVVWHISPPGRMLDYKWAENDLSWDWHFIFARPRDMKTYRVRITHDKVTESVEEMHVSREVPFPAVVPGSEGIISLKQAAAAAFSEGAPPFDRPMAIYNTPGKWSGGTRPLWEFLFGSVYRIYRVDAVSGLLLEVIQFDPDTKEKLDHLLDTGEMQIALENSGELFIYRFIDSIDTGRQDVAVKMMDPSFAGNEQTAEMWKDNFASLEVIRVVSIIKESEKKWHEGHPLFRVELFAVPDPGRGFYGWDKGFNTRWISLSGEAGKWEILEIATGP